MSRKENLKVLLSPDVTAAPEPSNSKTRVPSGAVKAMGLTLGRLQDDAHHAEAIKTQLENGETVVELDPAYVESSFVADRLSADHDTELSTLIESIRNSGQQVPALVRPHPEKPGHYQVAYGHRRLHAARTLNLKLKAVIRRLSNEELVVAQGQENLGRRDLTFIERALFATNLDALGFDRATLNAALSVHSAEVTRYLSVTKLVPASIIQAIGPAPKAGRTRWMELSTFFKRPKGRAAAEAAIKNVNFQFLKTDSRFSAVYEAARAAENSGSQVEFWQNPRGQAIVRIERGPSTTRLATDERLAPAFGDFLISRLDEIFQAFEEHLSGQS